MRVVVLLVVPLAFAAGLLLGRMLVTSRPPLPVDAKVVDSAPRERRASPLQVVTRQLAQEQRRQQELQAELDELRAAHQRHQRQALEIQPGDASWPCGLLASRVDAARLRKQWCAHAGDAAADAGAAAAAVAACTGPPEPMPSYVVLSFSPGVDSASSRLVEWNGVWDASQLPLLDAALALAADSMGMGDTVVVDVGAHFGAGVSLYSLARGAHVVAIEMQPPVARALSLAAGLNGWSSRLTVHERAVGPPAATELRYNATCDNTMVATARPPAKFAEAAAAVAGSAAVGTAGREAVSFSAPPIVLDDALAALEAPIAFLRVDVHAAEAAALRGASSTLSSRLLQPRFVALSVRASHAREPLDLLHRGGYVCAPAERAPPPVRGGAKWVGWEAEAMLRWLRERDGYAEVRCISKEARTAFWAQE